MGLGVSLLELSQLYCTYFINHARPLRERGEMREERRGERGEKRGERT
jgi:hypothetical protein